MTDNARADYFEFPNDIKAPIFFANRQWAVTGFGLECLSSDYPIEASRLWEADWESHMAMKVWVDGSLFNEAIEKARAHHRNFFKSVGDQINSHEKKSSASNGNVVEIQ